MPENQKGRGNQGGSRGSSGGGRSERGVTSTDKETREKASREGGKASGGIDRNKEREGGNERGSKGR